MTKGILKVALIFILLILIGWGIKIAFFPAHVINKGIEAGYQIADKTLDADNILQNYEFFKQQYQDYKALVSTVEMSQKQVADYKAQLPAKRDSWSESDKNELDRLNIVLVGQKQQLNNIASEYNAKSKMQNRSLFKTKDLPYELDYVN
jgi:hypothetical protein